MSPIAVSLLVHENPEILADQLDNFARYMPEAIIIVHISAGVGAARCDYEEVCQKRDNTIINPVSLATRWGDMLSPIFSNIEYALNHVVDASHITFASSTDMLVKHGAGDYIRHHDIAYDFMGEIDQASKDPVTRACLDDPPFKHMLDELGIDTVIHSQIEGSFYPAALMRQIAPIIKNRFDVTGCSARYYREELIISTIANHLLKKGTKVGMPFTLRSTFARHWIMGFAQKHPGMRLPARIIAKLMDFKYPMFWRLSALRKSLANNFENLATFSTVNGMRRFQPSSIHAIKRVRTEINDPVRQYLRTH